MSRRRAARPTSSAFSSPLGLDSDDEAEAELVAATAAAAVKKATLGKLHDIIIITAGGGSPDDAVQSVSEVFTLHPNWIDADVAGRGVKQTALHTGCKHGHTTVVKWLLESGKANPNAATMSKNSPLHYACRFGHPACVELLLVNGAAAAPQNADGLTPEESICKAPSAADANAAACKKVLQAPAAAAVTQQTQDAAAAAALAEAKKQAVAEARAKAREERWNGGSGGDGGSADADAAAAAAAAAAVTKFRAVNDAFDIAKAEEAAEWKHPVTIVSIGIVGTIASAAASWTYVSLLDLVTKNRVTIESVTQIYLSDTTLIVVAALMALFVMWEIMVVALKIRQWRRSKRRTAAAAAAAGQGKSDYTAGGESKRDDNTNDTTSKAAAAAAAAAVAAAFTPNDALSFQYTDLVAATTSFADGRMEGSGKFGSVYRGMLPSLGLTVAVKVFDVDVDSGAADVDTSQKKSIRTRAFEAEVSALSASQHPNFVQLLGVSRDGPRNCIVTGFMPGGTLRQRLCGGRHEAPLTWRQRLSAVVGAVRGLAFLHNRLGHVHMDVRPANILLDTAANSAKLANFGMVVPTGTLGEENYGSDSNDCGGGGGGGSGGGGDGNAGGDNGDAADDEDSDGGGGSSGSGGARSRGTAVAVFCSPELLAGSPASSAMDVFSIGVSMLEAVTGKRAENPGRFGNNNNSNVSGGGGGGGKKKGRKGKKHSTESGTVLDVLAAPLRQLQGHGHPGRLETYIDPAIASEEAVRAEAVFAAAAACVHTAEGERPSTAELLDMLEMLLETASANETFAADKQQDSLELLEQSLGITSRKNWQSFQQKGMDHKKLFSIPQDSAEYGAVAADFQRTLPQKTIVRLERVENGPQHEAFHLAAATIRKQLGNQFDPSTMQRMLFHGTTAIESIVNSTDGHGFLPLLTGTAVGGMFGDGTYFARDAKYSDDYARKLHGSTAAQKQMLVVEVVVGKWTKGKKGVKVMPLLPGQQYARYNSLVNDRNDPSIFVVHHSNQAYPAYLITYE